MKTATFRVALLLVLAAISARNRGQAAAGFTSKPHSADPNSEITVNQILANPQAYSHRVVKVRGCYVSGYELSSFASCDATGPLGHWPGKIWVESSRVVLWEEEYVRSLNRPIRGPDPVHLLFHYDAQKEDAAWRKLNSSRGLRVSILAQFETAEGSEHRFGHMGGWSHELILMDVLRLVGFDSRP